MVAVVSTPKEYDAVLQANEKVVVDFFATWCGPCRILKPLFEAWEKEYPKIKFITIDVDEAAELAEARNIQAMPTIKCVRNGQEVTTIVGADKGRIADAIRALDEM